MNAVEILVAHAPDEEYYAVKISDYLKENGFKSSHRGTVIAGESIIADTSRLLEMNSPIVVCGTVRSMGTGWARRVIQAAQERNCRIYLLQIEQDAYLRDLSLDTKIMPFWQDETKVLRDLITALRTHFHADQEENRKLNLNLTEFEEQKSRVISSISNNKRKLNYE